MGESHRTVALAPGALLRGALEAAVSAPDVLTFLPAEEVLLKSRVAGLADYLEAHEATDVGDLILGDDLFTVNGDQDTSVVEGLKVAFQATKAALRGMMRARYGRIILVAPPLNDSRILRGAVMGSLAGFAKSVSREVGSRGITANVLALGGAESDPLSPYTAVPRPVTVSDVGEAIRYLRSPDSAYFTGQVLWIDGGLGLA